LADIRLTERDKIKMGDCFRLGDLVRAKVVSSSSSSPLSSLFPSLFLLLFFLHSRAKLLLVSASLCSDGWR